METSLRAVHTLLECQSGNATVLTDKAPVLAQQIGSLASIEAYPSHIRQALTTLSLTLHNIHPLGSPPTPAQMAILLNAIGDEYEKVIFLLRSHASFSSVGYALPTLRPVNYHRNVFHVLNALLAVLFYEFILTYTQAVIIVFLFLAWYAAMDFIRRLFPNVQAALFDRLFSRITRPRERFTVPAATWYCVGMLLVLLFAEKTVAQVSVLVLGVGDPAATLIGRSVRSPKIYGQKSVAGFIGFASVSFSTVLLFLAALRPQFSLPYSMAMAWVAGAVGAVAELFSNDRVDDNISVPVTVALALSLLF